MGEADEGAGADDPRVPGTGGDDPVPLVTAAAWQQAEGRLYPAVTTRPDLYQRAVRLVRLALDRLRVLGPSTGALLAAAARGPELVAEVAADAGVPTFELDLDLVAGAALAMRHREVEAEQASARRLRAVAEAHRAGQRWAVVEERGDRQGDPFLPYTRLEVHVATGRALLVTARPDEEFRGVEHGVEQVRLDLTTGAVEEDRNADGTAATPPSAEAREDHVRRLKEQLGGS